jgi:hypothetical protein
MSPLRLLTTGKSLVGLTESESRYRVTRERFLPQFGPVKNPFCTTNRSDPVQSEAPKGTDWAPAPSQQAAKAPQLPAGNLSGTPSVAASKLPVILPDPHRPGSKGGLRSRAMAFQIKWAVKLQALFSRPAPNPARAVLARPTAPVQGELSLDRIKVVRNDLSDADLEIVPRQPPAARTGAAPVLQVAERTAEGGMTWGRFSGLFGAGKR